MIETPFSRVWEIYHLRVYENVKYTCVEFAQPPDRHTVQLLQEFGFMYGYLDWFEDDVKKGVACWHAVSSPMTYGVALDIARTAIPEYCRVAESQSP